MPATRWVTAAMRLASSCADQSNHLGADCEEKEMRPEHMEILRELLLRGECDAKPAEFKRFGSARTLYNFDVDNAALLGDEDNEQE